MLRILGRLGRVVNASEKDGLARGVGYSLALRVGG